MASHPYSPLSLQLPGYAPQILTARHILGPFFVAVAIIIVISWLLSGWPQPKLSLGERLVICWWATTGSIHMAVEGAFAAWPSFYQNTSPNIFSELWKEYSKADSRYAARDSCVVSIESVTAFVEGPLCFLIFSATGQTGITTVNKSSWPSRAGG
ncbi:hypothetical protein CBR_g55168 [Chara braunii]|uniref:EXPERA domain-containing protein n=1 Tax=Chara braunii TaxID=69332 RepID=A0A388MCT7_CHABU|nr:hypothetical protein CBR_g55168 [Chara braunii]|eukprot:GBG92323.1 hypothetical protein CBR_g55168 [Chara braunii]